MKANSKSAVLTLGGKSRRQAKKCFLCWTMWMKWFVKLFLGGEKIKVLWPRSEQLSKLLPDKWCERMNHCSEVFFFLPIPFKLMFSISVCFVYSGLLCLKVFFCFFVFLPLFHLFTPLWMWAGWKQGLCPGHQVSLVCGQWWTYCSIHLLKEWVSKVKNL
jgi:hypothetical protein